MVKTWAEKEMRNLRRLHAAGIPSPQPILLKNHILVMEFLGTDGWPAPRMKDAPLSTRKFQECYWQTVRLMRKMYQVCKLVHGDLSEYNMLYHPPRGGVIFIDVSQSVEHDHPCANEFLRKDCFNVNAFFKKNGLDPMTTRALYDFVIDPSIKEDDEDEAIQRILENLATAGSVVNDDAIFMQTFLPRSLHEVSECASTCVGGCVCVCVYARAFMRFPVCISCRCRMPNPPQAI